MVNIQAPFLAANQAAFGQPSPVPAVGEDLFTFLANRLLMSFADLGCQGFGLTNTVTENVVLTGPGAATSATFSTTPQQASIVGGQGATGGGGTGGDTATQATLQQLWQQWTGQGQRKGRGPPTATGPSGM